MRFVPICQYMLRASEFSFSQIEINFSSGESYAFFTYAYKQI